MTKELYLKRGATDTWLTPPDLVRSLGEFDLDPCAAVGQPWKLGKVNWTEEDDGLSKDWQGRVFMNPPYSRGAIGPFIERFVEHGDGIALVFPRVDTAWFQRLIGASDALLLKAGRIAFCRLDGTPGKKFLGSVFAAIGRGNVVSLKTSGIKGRMFYGSELERTAVQTRAPNMKITPEWQRGEG